MVSAWQQCSVSAKVPLRTDAVSSRRPAVHAAWYASSGRLDEEQSNCQRAGLGLDRRLHRTPAIDASIRKHVGPALELDLQQTRSDHRRCRQDRVGDAGGDVRDLTCRIQRRLARPFDVDVGEPQQRAEMIVLAARVLGAPRGSAEGLDGEGRLAGGELRLSELQHHRQLGVPAAVVRQEGGVGDGAVQQRRGFARRVALERVRGGEAEVMGSAGVVVRAVEVAGEIADRVLFASCEKRFDGLADARMRFGPLRRRV